MVRFALLYLAPACGRATAGGNWNQFSATCLNTTVLKLTMSPYLGAIMSTFALSIRGFYVEHFATASVSENIAASIQ
jgi:hypothetical protein